MKGNHTNEDMGCDKNQLRLCKSTVLENLTMTCSRFAVGPVELVSELCYQLLVTERLLSHSLHTLLSQSAGCVQSCGTLISLDTLMGQYSSSVR